MSPNPARQLPIIIPPLDPPKASEAVTLIFIYGYTWSAKRFTVDPPNKISIAHHIHSSPSLQHLKIIIPEGLPITWPDVGGNTWYAIDQPIPSAGNPDKLDEFGQHNSDPQDIEVSLDYFESLMDIEIANGTPANRIVFFGDSQGASILYLFLLTRKRAADLGAVVTWGGFLPVSLETVTQMQERDGLLDCGKWAKNTKLFMLHGGSDHFVPPERGRALAGILEDRRVRGQGFVELEWKVVDGLRHLLSVGVWPHVREVLEKFLEAENAGLNSKL